MTCHVISQKYQFYFKMSSRLKPNCVLNLVALPLIPRNITNKLFLPVKAFDPGLKLLENGVTFCKFFFQTIPDKRGGARSKFSPPPNFNVYNQVIFSPFCLKKRDIFQYWLGGWEIRDTAQVSHLLLAGIVDGHQHGVTIEISINLGKQFLRIS